MMRRSGWPAVMFPASLAEAELNARNLLSESGISTGQGEISRRLVKSDPRAVRPSGRGLKLSCSSPRGRNDGEAARERRHGLPGHARAASTQRLLHKRLESPVGRLGTGPPPPRQPDTYRYTTRVRDFTKKSPRHPFCDLKTFSRPDIISHCKKTTLSFLWLSGVFALGSCRHSGQAVEFGE